MLMPIEKDLGLTSRPEQPTVYLASTDPTRPEAGSRLLRCCRPFGARSASCRGSRRRHCRKPSRWARHPNPDENVPRRPSVSPASTGPTRPEAGSRLLRCCWKCGARSASCRGSRRRSYRKPSRWARHPNPDEVFTPQAQDQLAVDNFKWRD